MANKRNMITKVNYLPCCVSTEHVDKVASAIMLAATNYNIADIQTELDNVRANGQTRVNDNGDVIIGADDKPKLYYSDADAEKIVSLENELTAFTARHAELAARVGDVTKFNHIELAIIDLFASPNTSSNANDGKKLNFGNAYFYVKNADGKQEKHDRFLGYTACKNAVERYAYTTISGTQEEIKSARILANKAILNFVSYNFWVDNEEGTHKSKLFNQFKIAVHVNKSKCLNELLVASSLMPDVRDGGTNNKYKFNDKLFYNALMMWIYNKFINGGDFSSKYSVPSAENCDNSALMPDNMLDKALSDNTGKGKGGKK